MSLQVGERLSVLRQVDGIQEPIGYKLTMDLPLGSFAVAAVAM